MKKVAFVDTAHDVFKDRERWVGFSAGVPLRFAYADSLIAYWVRVMGLVCLKVDIDHKRIPALKRLQSRLARANFSLVWLVKEPSPSGRGWHLWAGVTPQPKNAVEMVCLQLILGSDVLRESYNLNRARQVDHDKVPDWWCGRWNVFYSKAGNE